MAAIFSSVSLLPTTANLVGVSTSNTQVSGVRTSQAGSVLSNARLQGRSAGQRRVVTQGKNADKDAPVSDKSSEDVGKVMNSISEKASGKGREFGHDAARDEENQEEGPGSDPVPKDGVIATSETVESASAAAENAAKKTTEKVKQDLPGN